MTDEAQLIERAKSGEIPAFRELMERHQVTIFRTAFDMMGNRHDAEDVTQEVFLKVHRGLGRFRAESKMSTWLYRITINACHDHMSRRSFQTTRPADHLERVNSSAPLFHGGGDVTPDRSAESELIARHVEQALSMLSPRERSIFVLRHYHDLTMKEIAVVLRISEGTVKSMLFRALQRLQKELAFYKKDLGLEKTR